MKADQVSDAASGDSISLPEPDTDNITVLTKALPNDPILPWHHYDSPWLEAEDKDKAEAEGKTESDKINAQETSEKNAEALLDRAEVEPKAESDKTNTEGTSEEKAEVLLVELKEKIEAEIELLEHTEPQAQSIESNGKVEEIAELARELASKLEAKQAVAAEAPVQTEQETAEAELDSALAEESEDLIDK